MKNDFSWNGNVRWRFRIFSAILSLLFLPMGIWELIDSLKAPHFVYDSSFKFGISATAFGIIFLVVAIRGFLFRMKK